MPIPNIRQKWPLWDKASTNPPPLMLSAKKKTSINIKLCTRNNVYQMSCHYFQTNVNDPSWFLIKEFANNCEINLNVKKIIISFK
jgi:hypothetical protein